MHESVSNLLGCFIGCKECDHASGRRQTDLCKSGMAATNNGEARSLNLNVTPGALNDIFKHNPWRAPGSAPVGDVCGFAGGTPYGNNGPEVRPNPNPDRNPTKCQP
jgi:hypothetical protein